MKKDKYQIKNDIDFEAALIAVGFIYYPYACPAARKRFDEMSEDEKIFYKKHFTGKLLSDIMEQKGEESNEQEKEN